MKRQIFFVFLILVLFIVACGNNEQVKRKEVKCGEITDVPSGLLNSASVYVRRKEGASSSVSSIVVRAYPNNLYLVTIEEQYSSPTNSNGNIIAKPAETIKTVNYIAQIIKGSTLPDWQLQEATAEAMQLFGMKCE